jgi:hypothetical protein
MIPNVGSIDENHVALLYIKKGVYLELTDFLERAALHHFNTLPSRLLGDALRRPHRSFSNGHVTFGYVFHLLKAILLPVGDITDDSPIVGLARELVCDAWSALTTLPSLSILDAIFHRPTSPTARK